MSVDSKMTAIADAIRAKTGKTAALSLDAMATEIEGIVTEDILLPAEYPDYVRTEAAKIAAKVRAVIKDDSIVSIKISDSHYGKEAQTNESCISACSAIKALTYLLPIDYIAHMGDISKGTVSEDNDTQKAQTAEFMKYFLEAVGNIPLFVAIGNHDTAIYYHNGQSDGEVHTMPAEWLYENFTALSESGDTVFGGESCGGYCYRDFKEKKLRVFLLNTSENLVVNQYDNGTSETQRLWVAQALQELNTKSDAAEWGFVVLCHYALDYGDACPISNVFKAYVNGSSITVGGETVNYSGANLAQFYAQFHGHYHCFVYDSLYGYEVYGTMNPYGVWRLCTPNACYNSENNYTSRDFYGLWYCEDTAYTKTPDTAEDTSLVVDVITPSEKMLYSFCYGAGYDRTVTIDGTIYHSISKSLSNVTVSDESGTSVREGESYYAVIAPEEGYDMESVVVTMDGADITAEAFDESTGVISIGNVTGAVSITAAASKPVNYTNLVPAAQVFTNGDTSALDGVGYRDGYYQSSNGGIGSAASGYTCTGLIPYARKSDGTFPTIYIKGCEWAATSQCRLYYYGSTKTAIATSNYGGTATGGNVEKWQTITTLGDKYYSFDSNDTMDSAVQQPAYFAISLKGSGADLIITLDEPIE